MTELERYNKWIVNLFKAVPFSGQYDFAEKEANILKHSLYMLDRTQSMFEYTGLPDTIPQRILEIYLQVNGFAGFAKYEESLYVFFGGLGGEPDVYYRPTEFIVSNPALRFNKNLRIDTDCVIMPNDSLYQGMMPLFNRYASQITESELSLYIAIINSRIVDLITASDDSTAASAQKFLSDIKDGKLGVIADQSFLEGIKAHPYGTSGHANQITQIIEALQYSKAGWFNELGLNANYNMKREALSSAESQLNNDALLPLVDDMLRCRKEALDKVNAMFGTDISVKLASAWEDNEVETELQQDILAQAAEGSEEPEEEPEEPEMKEGDPDDIETE